MSLDVNLTITGTVESMHLEPGDRVICTLDRRPTGMEVEAIAEQLERSFPEHRVIVLPPGLRLARQAA